MVVWVAGHDDVRASLRSHPLGRPALLLGPKGVGKSLVVRDWIDFLRKEHGLQRIGISSYPRLDGTRWLTPMESVRQIETEIRTRISSTGSVSRVVAVDLDWLSEAAANALLLTLEEPPPGVQFVLVAASPPLPTVVSRSIVYRLTPLTDDQVLDVLETLGVPDPLRLVPLASGVPGVAVHYSQLLQYRGRALQIFRAIGDASPTLLSSVLTAMRRPPEDSGKTLVEYHLENESVLELVVRGLQESRTIYRLFTSEELHGVDRLPKQKRDQAIRVLLTRARPELRLRVAVQALGKK